MHGLKWSDLWDWVGGGLWVELPADASGACAAARSPWLTPPCCQDSALQNTFPFTSSSIPVHVLVLSSNTSKVGKGKGLDCSIPVHLCAAPIYAGRWGLDVGTLISRHFEK